MATLNEIIDEQTRIAARLADLDENPGTTEDEHGNLRDTLIARWKELDTQRSPLVKQLEDLKMIQRAAQDPGNTEDGDGGAAPRWDGAPQFMHRKDPFADLDMVKQRLVRGGEMVSRAQTAIEHHAKRGLLPGDRGDEATLKAQRDPMIARHMLLTGHDDYLEAFRTYLNDPMGEGQAAVRALTLGTASAGFLLPYVLDPTIVLTNSGSTNPYRRISEVKTTTSNAWQGANSAGITSAWLDEAGTAADVGTPVGQIQIFAKKAAAWVIGSFEAMSDTNYAEQLPGMLADEKDIREEAGFALGTGPGTANTGQPLGISNALGTAQKVAPVNAGTAGGAFGGTAVNPVNDVYNLNSGLGPRFRLSANVGWVANITTINKIRAIDTYGGGGFWTNLQDDRPPRLLNKPIEESPSLASPGTAGTAPVAVFGDWSKFYIVDRIGATMLFDPLIKAASAANQPTGQQGWFYYWRVGSGVAAQNAFRYITNA